MADKESIRIGISSCLLGQSVRYDGSHKRNSYCADVLEDYFEWVPVCPEVEVGMETPREAVRLAGDPAHPRMLGRKSGRDWTDAMRRYATSRLRDPSLQELDGYVLKSRSPSCGMERVKVYAESGMPAATGPGLFARALMDALPDLPVEEEGRLRDAGLRERFIVRVFSHHRWRQLVRGGLRIRELVKFHEQHKYLIMAHDEVAMRQLGSIVAGAKAYTPAKLISAYGDLFFAALRKRSTPRKHTNVLQHIAGFFKKEIDAIDRQELAETIDAYRLGQLPLIVPITLIRHHLLRVDAPFVRDQIYLAPHPKELMLLNHV